MTVECIVAMSENNVIGVNNKLPWHLSEDLKHFKKITMGKAILMGRNTYESIGKPLPGRTNIVLTSDPAYAAPGCMVVNSIDEAFEVGDALDNLVIMGGQSVYEQCMDRVEILHLTLVHTTLPGDATFPDVLWKEWEEDILLKHKADDKNEFSFTIKTYKKRKIDSIHKSG